MGLKIIEHENLMCPSVFCDHCGLKIDDAGWGAYMYRHQDTDAGADIYFAHKGECMDAMDEKIAGVTRYLHWGEISLLPRYLGRNMGMEI